MLLLTARVASRRYLCEITAAGGRTFTRRRLLTKQGALLMKHRFNTPLRVFVLLPALLLVSSCKDLGSNPITTPPGIPIATAATGLTINGFTANWQASENAAEYRLDVAQDSLFGGFVSGHQDKNVGNVTSYAVAGLISGRRYFYRVRAVGAGGTSANSNTVGVTVSTTSTTLAAPTALAGTGVTVSGFTANWSAVNGATGYRFDMSRDSSFASLLPGYNNKDVGNVTSLTLAGIGSGARYFYRLRAINVTETSGNSNTIGATLPTSFSLRVHPILDAYGCTGCHGGNGGLTVGTVGQLLTGGDHGPAVVPFNAATSTIIRKLTEDPPPFGSLMPRGAAALPADTVLVIRNWINQGAQNN